MIRKMILAALLALPMMGASATTYYFSSCDAGVPSRGTPAATCVAGNNANDGLTTATPKRNAAGISVTNLPAGSSFKLARGGVWANSWGRVIVKSNFSTKAQPFLVEDYVTPAGSGADAPPKIIIDASLPTADCTALCNRPFEFAGVASRAGIEGYVIRNLFITGMRDAYASPPVTGPSVSGVWGLYLLNGTGIIIDNMDLERGSLGIESGGSPRAVLTRDIWIKNSRMRYNSQGIHGVYTDALIENNDISDNAAGTGSQAAFIHNVYFSGFINSIFRNNRVERNAIDVSTGKCNSVSVVMHGVVDNSVFENNLVREDDSSSACFSLAADPAYSTAQPPEEFKKLVIRNNRFINFGNYGVGLSSCNDCVIENNLLYKAGGSVGGYAIGVPGSNPTNHSINGTPNQDLVGSPRVHIRNNTIYIAGYSPGYPSRGIRHLVGASSGGGTGHTITNNIIVFGGSSAGTQYCFDVGTPAPGDFAAINNNLCYGIPAVTNLLWAQAQTLAQAQALGFSTVHSTADPLFVSLPTAANGWQMSIQSGSPAKNAGSATYKARLGYGNAVPTDARDIGAYEYGTVHVAPQSPVRAKVK